MMKDRLLGDDSLAVNPDRVAGVHVAIQLRKAAARHMNPQPVSALHPPGGVAEVNLVFLDCPGAEKNFPIEAMTKTRTAAPFAHQHRAAIGEDIDQFGDEIR